MCVCVCCLPGLFVCFCLWNNRKDVCVYLFCFVLSSFVFCFYNNNNVILTKRSSTQVPNDLLFLFFLPSLRSWAAHMEEVSNTILRSSICVVEPIILQQMYGSSTANNSVCISYYKKCHAFGILLSILISPFTHHTTRR